MKLPMAPFQPRATEELSAQDISGLKEESARCAQNATP